MDKKSILKKKIIPVAIVFCVIAILCAAWFIYAGNYYHALNKADLAKNSSTEVTVTENSDGSIIFYPVNLSDENRTDSDFTDSELYDFDLTDFDLTDSDSYNVNSTVEIPKAGIIFYPGAKVEYTSYAPLMFSLAERGYLCILMKMPQNMAILDVNAADGIMQNYPEIEHWYMAGHSMGGAMAATYIRGHADSFDGLILLAAYSSSDLSDMNLQVLSVYGSEDGVLNRKMYENCRKNLPGEKSTEGSTEEYVIEGGCHAYFGMYGAQQGDGNPTISNEDQIDITTDVIDEWILKQTG